MLYFHEERFLKKYVNLTPYTQNLCILELRIMKLTILCSFHHNPNKKNTIVNLFVREATHLIIFFFWYLEIPNTIIIRSQKPYFFTNMLQKFVRNDRRNYILIDLRTKNGGLFEICIVCTRNA